MADDLLKAALLERARREMASRQAAKADTQPAAAAPEVVPTAMRPADRQAQIDGIKRELTARDPSLAERPNALDELAAQVLAQHGGMPPEQAEGGLWPALVDAGAAGAAGISRGVTGLLDTPGALFSGAGNLVTSGLERAGVVSPGMAQGMRDSFGMMPMGDGTMATNALADATGGASQFRGNTLAGNYAGTVGEFLPGALVAGSGNMLRDALAYGVAPGLASEAAGQATEGSAFEPFARTGAAVAAALLAGSLTRPSAPKAPTVDELRGQADDLYRAGDARPPAEAMDVQGLKGQMMARLQQESAVTPQGRVVASPGVRQFLDVLDDYDGSQMTPQQMQSLRRFLQDAAGSADPTDRRMGALLLDEFDQWRHAHVPEFQQADQLYGRMKRAQDVDWRIEKADRRAASTGTGGNAVNAARQNIRQILDNPKAARGYSPEELLAMEKIVRGSPVVNALRLGGRLSPTSGALPLMGNIAGVGVSPAVGLPVMVGSYGMKTAAEMATSRQIDLLSELIRNGGSLPQPAGNALSGVIPAILGASAH